MTSSGAAEAAMPPCPHAAARTQRVPEADPILVRELRGWLGEGPRFGHDGLALARLVARQVRRTGKHLLGGPLLTALGVVQRRHLGRDPFLDAFLFSVLDRHQDRFRNQSYLALPLIDLVMADPGAELDPERLSALLVIDIIRNENQNDDVRRIDPAVRQKRVRHAEQFVAAVDPRYATEPPPPPRCAAGDWLALSVLPVSVVHDEYFFIRALQTRELVFATLTTALRRATEALRAGRTDAATATVLRANEVFQRAALLFRIVATLRAQAFHTFREFTDGASAIQSESYKLFELACGEPSTSRSRSDAFTNVPVVQAEALRQPDNLARAMADLHRRGDIDGPAATALDSAVGRLEASHQKWKTTHHGFAARMLGDEPGSVYTAGVPYLRDCLRDQLVTQPNPADAA